MRQIPQWCWRLDEVFVKNRGETHYLWRAANHAGEVLEAYLTKKQVSAVSLQNSVLAMDRCQAIAVLAYKDPLGGVYTINAIDRLSSPRLGLWGERCMQAAGVHFLMKSLLLTEKNALRLTIALFLITAFGLSSASAQSNVIPRVPPSTILEDIERGDDDNDYSEIEFSDTLHAVLIGRAIFRCKFAHPKDGFLRGVYWDSVAEENGLSRRELLSGRYYMLNCLSFEYTPEAKAALQSGPTGTRAFFWYTGLFTRNEDGGFNCRACRLYFKTSDYGDPSLIDFSSGDVDIVGGGHTWVLPAEKEGNRLAILVGEDSARHFQNYILEKTK